MPDTVIEIENLGKVYRIYHKRPQGYFTLRESLGGRHGLPPRADGARK